MPNRSQSVTNDSIRSDWKFAIRALRHRNYALFFSGQTVSLIGTWMTRIATAWLVYRLTHSPFLLGLVGFCGQIPVFLLGPFAGVWVDRWNRHRVLVVTQILSMVQSFALACLALSHRITVTDIILLSLFQGTINAFDMPARQAFVIQMVENREDLPNAIALNSSMVNVSRLLGPSIAGAVIAISSEGYCFLIDGVSYLAVIASLLAMTGIVEQPAKVRRRVLQELVEGWRYVSGFVPIRSILLLLALGVAGGHALHRADAAVCRARAARRPAHAGLPDGSGGRGRAHQRDLAGGAQIRAGPGTRDSPHGGAVRRER